LTNFWWFYHCLKLTQSFWLVSACSAGMGFPRFIALRCVTATNPLAHSAGYTPGTRQPPGGPWPRGRSRRVPVMLGIEVQWLPTKVMDMDVTCQGKRRKEKTQDTEREKKVLKSRAKIGDCVDALVQWRMAPNERILFWMSIFSVSGSMMIFQKTFV